MRCCGKFSGIGITSFDCIDDPLMFGEGQRPRPLIRPQSGVEKVSADIQLMKQITEKRITGQVPDCGVKLQVQPGLGERVCFAGQPRLLLAEHADQAAYIRGRRSFSRLPRGEAVEVAAHREDVRNIALVDRRNLRPSVGYMQR